MNNNVIEPEQPREIIVKKVPSYNFNERIIIISQLIKFDSSSPYFSNTPLNFTEKIADFHLN